MINLLYFFLFVFLNFGFSFRSYLSSVSERIDMSKDSFHSSHTGTAAKSHGGGKTRRKAGGKKLQRNSRKSSGLKFAKRRKKIANQVRSRFFHDLQQKQSDVGNKKNLEDKSIVESFQKNYIENDQGFLTISSKISENIAKAKETGGDNDIYKIIHPIVINFLMSSLQKMNEKKLQFNERLGIIVEDENDSGLKNEKKNTIIISIDSINNVISLLEKKFLSKTAKDICAISKINEFKIAERGDVVSKDSKDVLVRKEDIVDFLMKDKSIEINEKVIGHQELINSENEKIFKFLLRGEMTTFLQEKGLSNACMQFIALFSDFHSALWEVICAISLATNQMKTHDDYYFFSLPTMEKKIKIVHKDFVDKLSKDSLISLMKDYVAKLDAFKKEASQSEESDFLEKVENIINSLLTDWLNKKKDNDHSGWILNYLTVLLGTIEYLNIYKNDFDAKMKKNIFFALNKVFFEKTLKSQLHKCMDIFVNNPIYSKIFDRIPLELLLKNKYLYNLNMDSYLKQALAKNDHLFLLMYIGTFVISVLKYIENTDITDILNEKNTLYNYFNVYFEKHFSDSTLKKLADEKKDLIKEKNKKIEELSSDIIKLILEKRASDKNKFDRTIKDFMTQFENEKKYKDIAQVYVEENQSKNIQFPLSEWDTTKNIFISMSKKFDSPIEGLVKLNKSDFDQNYNILYFTFIQPLNKKLKALLKKEINDNAGEDEGNRSANLNDNIEKHNIDFNVTSQISDKLSKLFESLNNITDLGNKNLLRYVFQLNWNTCFAIKIYQDIIKNNNIEFKDLIGGDIIERVKGLLEEINQLLFLYLQHTELLYLASSAGYFIDGAKIMLVTSGAVASYLGVGSWLSGGTIPLLENTAAGVVAGGKKLGEKAFSNPKVVAAGVAAYGVWRYRGSIVNAYKKASSGTGAMANRAWKKVKNWFTS